MDELLAKPDITLLMHLQEVLEAGKDLTSRLNLDEELTKRALLACAYHDIGKATLSFQEYIVGQKKYAYPHALASLPIMLVAEKKSCGCPLLGTGAVLSHHSPLTPNLYRGWAPTKYHDQLSATIEVLLQILRKEGAGELPEAQECCQLINQSPSALLDTSMGFGAQRSSIRGILKDMPSNYFSDVKTVLHLADWIVSSGEKDISKIFLENGSQKVQSYIEHKTILLRSFQKEAEAAGQRLYLRAPTGSGKTEALLLWAGNTERILYLLPTQASVNAMWRRLQKVYGRERIGISHGRSGYIAKKEFEGKEEEALDFRLFGSIFAKPVVVGTLDQYLLGHLHGRYWEERLSLARRATVIIDEIHSYEPYTLGLLLRALEKDPPYKLAVASATFPNTLLGKFGKGPVVSAGETLWLEKRHELNMVDERIAKAVDHATAQAGKGESVLVIVNTVREAQKLYKDMKNSNTILLHSRFTFRDRQDKEEVAQRPQSGTILISTQVVEVSLDISYDVMFTEIAPVDAIVQRMGRVNRYGKRAPTPIFVFNEWDEGSEKIYGKDALNISREIFSELPSQPTNRELVEAANVLYGRIATSEEYVDELVKGKETLDDVQWKLGCYTMDLSEEELREKFATRTGTISIDVIPERFLGEAYAMMDKKEKWRLVELLVPIPIHWLFAFKDHFFSSDIGYFVTDLHYDEEIGLSPEEALEGSPKARII